MDYIFITRKDFEDRLARGEFLEYAEVFGNYYGTNRETFEAATRAGQDLVLDIDVQGARQLKVAIPQAISIFVLPPSRDVLEQRLRSRSQDSEEVIQRRLRGAAEEVRNYTQYDFVLINRDIERSFGPLGHHRGSRAVAQGPDGRGSQAHPRQFQEQRTVSRLV